MSQLKLVALDEEDLRIVSAHVQDAVLKVGEVAWLPRERRLVLPMNRFAWESRPRWFRRMHERRRSVLHFDRVLSVRTSGIHRDRADEVLSLMAVLFHPQARPSGTIELAFSGGATARLEVECIEARLADLGPAWEATSRPRHEGTE